MATARGISLLPNNTHHPHMGEYKEEIIMANKYEITINGITVGAPTQAEAIEIAKALIESQDPDFIGCIPMI